jgi:hypothetical protein
MMNVHHMKKVEGASADEIMESGSYARVILVYASLPPCPSPSLACRGGPGGQP